MEKNGKTHKLLRLYNWVFSASLFLGTLGIMFQATSTGIFYLLFFMLMFTITYTLPALLLYPEVSYILGKAIPINKSNKFLYSLSIGTNAFFLLLGCIIIIYAFLQGQYPISFFGFLFLLLSYFNIKALKSSLEMLE